MNAKERRDRQIFRKAPSRFKNLCAGGAESRHAARQPDHMIEAERDDLGRWVIGRQ